MAISPVNQLVATIRSQLAAGNVLHRNTPNHKPVGNQAGTYAEQNLELPAAKLHHVQGCALPQALRFKDIYPSRTALRLDQTGQMAAQQKQHDGEHGNAQQQGQRRP